MSKKKSTKEIKITADYVIDEYLASKKLRGLKRKEAMQRVKFLSKNLNKFIVSE